MKHLLVFAVNYQAFRAFLDERGLNRSHATWVTSPHHVYGCDYTSFEAVLYGSTSDWEAADDFMPPHLSAGMFNALKYATQRFLFTEPVEHPWLQPT